MSLLLSGKNRITEWIEKACFDAVVKGPCSVVSYKPKLVQILARGGGSGSIPQYVEIHDGHTSIVAFCCNNSLPPDAVKGTIIKIIDWSVSTVKHCAGDHYQQLTEAPPNTNSRAALQQVLRIPICLSIQTIQVMGGHGMGIIGDTPNVNDTIDIQRALQSIQYSESELTNRLKLQQQATMGNVNDLLSESTDAFEQVIEVAKQQQQNVTTIPIGNVAQLLSNAAEQQQDDENNVDPVDTMLSLAKQQQHQAAANSNTNTVAAVAPVIGNVEQLFASRTAAVPNQSNVLQDDTHPVDAILAAAAATAKETQTATETQNPNDTGNNAAATVPVIGNVQELFAATVGNVNQLLGDDNKDVDPVDAILAVASVTANETRQAVQEKDNSKTATTAAAASSNNNNDNEQPTPFGNVPKLLSRQNSKSLESLFLLADQQRRQQQEEGTFKDDNADKDDDAAIIDSNDSSSEEDEEGIVGISDMLISQTQQEELVDTRQDDDDDSGSGTDEQPAAEDAQDDTQQQHGGGGSPRKVSFARRQQAAAATTTTNGKRKSSTLERTMKRTKANDFFRDLMFMARNDANTPRVISLQKYRDNDFPKTTTYDGMCIRTWLEANVRP